MSTTARITLEQYEANEPAGRLRTRGPHEGSYQSLAVLRAGQEARPLAFPDVSLPGDRIFLR